MCAQWPPLCQNFIGGHLWTIWHLRWSGGDEVGATGGHVDQQLEDDDGHYVDFQWAEKRKKRQMPILNEFYMVIFTSKFIFPPFPLVLICPGSYQK